MSGDSAAVKAERIASARLRKASKLAAVLHDAGATVADYDAGIIPWDLATATANVRPPSDDTKALVREALARYDARRSAR